jgi:hypothetical protein
MISVSLDPLKSSWLASDLQHADIKHAVTSRLYTLDKDFFYTGIQALVP